MNLMTLDSTRQNVTRLATSLGLEEQWLLSLLGFEPFDLKRLATFTKTKVKMDVANKRRLRISFFPFVCASCRHNVKLDPPQIVGKEPMKKK